jgi:agmatinase
MPKGFDPDAAAAPGSGLFGLPHGPHEAAVWVQPVPFDATTSYRQGTARGPQAVLEASRQVDLFDLQTGRPYEHGIHLLPADPRVIELQREGSERASGITACGGELGGDAQLEADLERVNAIGAEVNAIVRESTTLALEQDKLPVVLGGDHSVPFGAIEAVSDLYPGIGILHFDAHADLREAYEGFIWSHASIFHNVLQRIDNVSRLVQVGVRDLGEREHEAIRSGSPRITTIFDNQWAEARLAGGHLRAMVREALARLPETVYVSFDVDGLDPALCPNTGTPVPGGLTWHEAMLWLEELARSGRRVVGLDLCEVRPGQAGSQPGSHADEPGDSWDAIVGARLLYRLVGTALATREAPSEPPAQGNAPGRRA